jgi:Undecaprenyl-phosphate glucose phosphotransferase
MQQHRFFRSVLTVADLMLIAVASMLAYDIRFHWLAEVEGYAPTGTFTYRTHAVPVIVIVPIMLLTMQWAGLYQPRRDHRFGGEMIGIVKASFVGMAATIVTMSLVGPYFFGTRDYSRLQYLICGALVLVFLMVWRFSFRSLLRKIRRRGWNLRHVAIIGTGRLGQVVYRTLMRNTWTGIKPAIFISHHATTVRSERHGRIIAGGLDDLEAVLDESHVSGVILALPAKMIHLLPGLLARLEKYPLDVRIVPDMNPRFFPMNMTVSELDGMPVLSLRETPLSGWGAVTKRAIDIAGAVVGLVIFAAPMVVVAAAVALSSRGPVIFRQERMSVNGKLFKIFKFRTMWHVEAERAALLEAEEEAQGTAAWTQNDDPRITPVGRWLRRMSLDELPQLVNVLFGEMSLVGPRPERPELIRSFREDWRGYMLRQNVKAGITGWAQVNGLRGQCSLKKRLQYDLFYIRNWSVWFDLRILWLTVFRGFVHSSAH